MEAAASRRPRPVFPCRLERPRVNDILFEYKTGKTKEGYNLEQIKGGSLFSLTWYFGLYAARKAHPACAPDASRLGLDPDFCHVFLTMLPSFGRASAVIQHLLAVLAAGAEVNDNGVLLCVADGLCLALDPSKKYLVALPSEQQVELLGGAANVLAEMQRIVGDRAGEALHPAEEEALALLTARIEGAKRVVDAGVAVGAACPAAPVLLQRVAEEAAREARYLSIIGGSDTEAPVRGEVAARTDGITTLLSSPPGSDVYVSAKFSRLWSVPLDILAAQWTLVEYALFRSIPTAEWLGFGWDGSRASHAADGCRRFIDHFNAMALWVTAEVLAQPSPAERAAMIVRFAQLAVHLRRFNNFSGLVEVSTGLRRDVVVRLDATWALVPAAARNKIMEIHTLVSDAQNYRAYKQLVKSLEPRTPVVPHLGAHTAEISAQEMLLPGEVPTPAGAKVLHFRRYRELASLLAPLMSMQEVGYEGAISRGAMPPVLPSAANLLNSALRPFYFYTEEDREAAVGELMAASRAVEPHSTTGQITF